MQADTPAAAATNATATAAALFGRFFVGQNPRATSVMKLAADKLLQMRKDDSALTPRELAAVVFARKLTSAPASLTDEDYAALRAEFGERGALDVVLQTANFAFMNRFTDNLGLPSEDGAIQVYREVYGADWE